MYSSLRTTNYSKVTSLLGSALVFRFGAGTNIDLNIMPQALSPPPNTKFSPSISCYTLLGILQDSSDHEEPLWCFSLVLFFPLCHSQPTNVETLLRAGQVPQFWTNLFVFLIDLLFTSLEYPYPFIQSLLQMVGGWV